LDIKAIIYTHPHVDHFGGVKGFVTDEDIEKKDIKGAAPNMYAERRLMAVPAKTFSETACSRKP
jgi:alkyl sulfatase BDS1-like metallo-beta-lactamase superfamily hydrolase